MANAILSIFRVALGTNTKISHEGNALRVDFIGSGGHVVSVHMVNADENPSDDRAIEQAKLMMVQLTAFGTRDGGGSLNTYDALSNGNFDDGAPLTSAERVGRN